MTRKDYIKIAEVFKTELLNLKLSTYMGDDERHNRDRQTWLLINKMAQMLRQDNPRFDTGRFVDYIDKA